MLNLVFTLTALAAVQASSPAATGRHAAAPADIASAVGDCWSAVGPTGVDRRLRRDRGWSAAVRQGTGERVAAAVDVYARQGSNALIMLGDQPREKLCIVVASLPSLADAGVAGRAIKEALLAADPKVKAAVEDGSNFLISLPRIAMIDGTGTKEKPGLIITVGYQGAERG